MCAAFGVASSSTSLANTNCDIFTVDNTTITDTDILVDSSGSGSGPTPSPTPAETPGGGLGSGILNPTTTPTLIFPTPHGGHDIGGGTGMI